MTLTAAAVATALSNTRGDWLAQERAQFVVTVLGGTRKTAEVLDVAPSQPSRWVSGQSVPGPLHARLLVDLDHVLAHALLVWDASVVPGWLVTANAYLDWARPIDWLKTNGSAEVVSALRQEASGAYA